MKKEYFLIMIWLLLPAVSLKAQIFGCTDKLAINYNPLATSNDGSCTYNAAFVTPVSSYNLGSNLAETSGLILWNNQIWTHNDNTDINLYALDTLNGELIRSQRLTGTLNKDWEEISQDDNFIYVGDFGNNNGNRTDLKIIRISKNSLAGNSPEIETINFLYSNQVNLNPAGTNHTDFDCEAFIVSDDSIYLFTKQWISNKTSVYALSKTPGNQIARYKFTYDVKGLITGAVYLKSEKLIVLCGYNTSLEPFLYLLYDFNGSDFFSGNKRKVLIPLPFHQVEGITSRDGLKYYISNENFTQLPVLSVPQKLHILDLKPFLSSYLNTLPLSFRENKEENDLVIYPVPSENFITIFAKDIALPGNYYIINFLGQVVSSGALSNGFQKIEISELPDGMYILRIGKRTTKVIKR